MTRIGLALSLTLVSFWVTASQGDNLSDPTRPLINTKYTGSAKKATDSKPQPKRNQLLGIITQPKGLKAIIDDKIVATGDSINGYVVHKIKSSSVILRKGKSYKTLNLLPSVKRISKQG